MTSVPRRPSLTATSSLTRSRTFPLASTDYLFSDTLKNWIVGIAVVDFDVDIGPVVRTLYPQLSLSAEEEENIAFSSFPDSTTSRTLTFSFRIRNFASTSQSSNQQHTFDYIYGYVAFMQRKDPSLRRGYLQRSVTILSPLPYPELFGEVVSRVALLYTQNGERVLTDTCRDVSTWPRPTVVGSVMLPLLGSSMNVDMPDPTQSFLPSLLLHSRTQSGEHAIAAAMPPLTPQIVSCFAKLLPSMWSVWECVILGEPILAFSSSPDLVSGVVWWLHELVKPVPFTGDFRPYFTIQDRDYHSFINRQAPKSGLLIGVTNSLLSRSCHHWPHAINLSSSVETKKDGVDIDIHELPPGWASKSHKRYTSKDRPLLKKMETLISSGTTLKMDAFGYLRHHFLTRSNEFLVPLNRYFTSLVLPPSATPSLPGLGTLPLTKTFDVSLFVSSLKQHGTPLPFRSTKQRNEFYQRWLASPSFGLWLAQKEENLRDALQPKKTSIEV